MKGIEINVGIYSEEDLKLKELDLPIEHIDDVWERRTFWRVDSAMVNRDNKEQTIFFVCGDTFVTDILYEDFVKLFNYQNNEDRKI